MCLRNTDIKFVVVSSGVLSLVYWEKFDNANLITNASKTAVSTERVQHFFDVFRMQLPFHRNEKLHLLFPIHDINIDDGAEARSYFGFIRLYDDAFLRTMTKSPSYLNWSTTTSSNRTTSTRSCQPRSTCVLSRRSTRAT